MKILGKPIAIALLFGVFLSFVLLVWIPFNQAFSIGLGTVFMLFLPGYIWLHALDLKTTEPLLWAFLSVVLSFSLVVLSSFYASYLGMPLTALNIFLLILLLLLSGVLIFAFRRRKKSFGDQN